MRLSVATLLAALCVASEVSATMMSPRANHAKLARRIVRKKRCLQRTTASPIDYHAHQTSSSEAPPPPSPSPDNSNNNNGNNGNNGNNNGGNQPSYGGSQEGTINAPGSPCGDPQGTTNPTGTGGPNGLESWLTCGVDGGGWVPPPIYLSNLVYKDLGTVLQQPGNPFSACSPFLGSFNDMAGQTGVPAILLASIALQESGCNSGATGPNGELGLMQITPDKCPAGQNCYDPGTNIYIGAQYFQSVLSNCGGNVAQAMGEWNGWYVGITIDGANNHPTCGSRNNLDYLQNVFNGFLQGVDPYTLNMGVFFNTRC